MTKILTAFRSIKLIIRDEIIYNLSKDEHYYNELLNKVIKSHFNCDRSLIINKLDGSLCKVPASSYRHGPRDARDWLTVTLKEIKLID